MLGLPLTEIIQANYSYISAQPIRDALELLEKGRYNENRPLICNPNPLLLDRVFDENLVPVLIIVN